MSLTLTILLSLLSAGILAGRVYEILNLTDAATGFLLVKGIVMNPYILGIFAVITLCCGVLIFGAHKEVKPYYSESSKYTAMLAGAAFIAAGGFAIQSELIAPFFIAGGAALVVMAVTGLGKKKSDIVVMILLLGFAAGMCMDVVTFDVSTYYNTVFMQNVMEYLCMTAFMLMVVKNVYMPSKHSRMMLYVTGILSFAVCSMMNCADIICYVMAGGQSLHRLTGYVATALFGVFAFDTAVSAIPERKETEKPSAEKPAVENPSEQFVVTEDADNEKVKTESAESQIPVAESADISAQRELEQMFDAFAEERAESIGKNKTADTAAEVILKEETEKDASKYTMFSELFGTESENEITSELPQSILGETRSFKKFSQPKLEESAPEYDMLKSMFKGEDTSQYQFDAEQQPEQDKKQLPQKQKRSFFGGTKKEKTTAEKTVAEDKPSEKTDMPSKTDSKETKTAGKTKFVASEPRVASSKAETKKIVYKKPK